MTNNVTAGSSLNAGSRQNLHHLTQLSQNKRMFLAWLYKSYKKRNGRIVSYDWFTLEGLAQRVVTGWMNSKRHKRNILKALYDRSGMGVAIAKDGKVYSTQTFC